MNFPKASRFADDHDVVLVGYRGVDGSSRLDCPEVVVGAQALGRLPRREVHARVRRGASGRCARPAAGATASTSPATRCPQRVDDLEAARVALGYRRIDLLSESAGTRTAMIYAWRYPTSIHRSVMIGVNPPGHFLWDGQGHRRADPPLRRAVREGRDAAARRTDDLAASMRRTAADIPDRWWFLPIKKGNVRLASFFGLMESTSAGGAALGADDARLVALGGRRRRERVLVHVAAGRPRLPRVVRLGRRRRGRPRPTPRPPRRYFSADRRPRLDPRRPGDRLHLGRRPPGRRLAGAARTRTSTAACGRRTSRRS